MYRKIIPLTTLVCLALLLEACDFVPVFDKEPFISAKDINAYSVPDFNTNPVTYVDSVVVTITFRDGDGDLGLSSSDTNPPFQDKNQDGTDNPYFYNYHVTPFKKVNGEFVPAELPSYNSNITTSLNGRFPRLKPDGEAGPIEGDLDYNFKIAPPPDNTNPYYIYPNDTVKFEIFIYDRALHKSNTVRTEEVVVLKR